MTDEQIDRLADRIAERLLTGIAAMVKDTASVVLQLPPNVTLGGTPQERKATGRRIRRGIQSLIRSHSIQIERSDTYKSMEIYTQQSPDKALD